MRHHMRRMCLRHRVVTASAGCGSLPLSGWAWAIDSPWWGHEQWIHCIYIAWRYTMYIALKLYLFVTVSTWGGAVGRTIFNIVCTWRVHISDSQRNMMLRFLSLQDRPSMSSLRRSVGIQSESLGGLSALGGIQKETNSRWIRYSNLVSGKLYVKNSEPWIFM